MDPREDVCVMNSNRQDDILAVCRRDKVRLYLKEEDVGEDRASVPYGAGTQDGLRMPYEDKDEPERYTSDMSEKEDEGRPSWRDDRSIFRTGEREVEWNASAQDEENNSVEIHEKENEKDMSGSCKKDDEQSTLTKNERYSSDVEAKEDEHDCSKADIDKDEWDASKRDNNQHGWGASESVEKEVEWDSVKQHEGNDSNDALERLNREEGQTALGRDEKQGLSFASRDKEEPDQGFPERDDEVDGPNALRREIEEVGTQVPNGETVENEFHNMRKDGREEDKTVHEKEVENSILEKDGENDPSSSSKEKDDESASPRNETEVNEQGARESEMAEETGEQVSSSLTSGVVKVADGAFQNIYFTGPVLPQSPTLGHRRSQSEIGTPGHRRTNSFQKLRTHMQKAWRGFSTLREDNKPSFNPEVLAYQKRQWYQLHSSKALDQTKYKEPASLFEHFIIVGLHPETNLEAVEEAFRKRKKWEMEMLRYEVADYNILRHRGPQLPILEPQILFRYPPAKKMAMHPKDLATFCFPGGVKARLLERTPSLSDLNELVYGQEHLGTDDSSFIFSFKVADDATLYGVCLHVSEIVQRPPGVLSTSSPLHSCGGGSHFLFSAPRCYCLLTRVPFFELHFEMLNSLIAQERLKRITEFVSEMSLAASCYAPSVSRPNDQTNGNTDSPVASQKVAEPMSPDSVVTSDSSEASHAKEIERDWRKEDARCYDDNSSEASDTRMDISEKMYKDVEKGYTSPEVILSDSTIRPVERTESSDSVFCSGRSVLLDEVGDGGLSNSENDFGDLIIEWARDHKNGSLEIICGYHSLEIPSRGSKLVFQPLDHLQAIEYTRPPVSALGLWEGYPDSCNASEVNARFAAAEEALALSTWTTATMCRVLSLETIVALLAGVLLEKQVVVVCANLGVLSATVMSLIPMIRPFQWQSLLLPVLPGRMFDFLEAPVPFLVGVQSKPADWKIKTSNLILVNVLNNQVKTCNLPALPRRRELMAQLSPIHSTLAHQSSVARRNQVNKCNEVQADAAREFLTVMRQYMESLCADLQSHTITSVQSNSDRVSLLLKDSFIDSFPSRDRPFIKLFVDTQLFSVQSDHHLSSFENGHI
ncbi:PREDICTED: uncharacterized protein LOC104814537 isoform X2 [Tarenaya hassleriana]|uniref:uncharacterized protein LOC104814537 isoform X2 n=1 Tax=Tarenaya hassleriana TaxID=28532 RepID=UPI00053C53C6|nr:PREDICTED: uncharacterized protein LOC104814537 isoform X2 [Tarenaya hassleriana]